MTQKEKQMLLRDLCARLPYSIWGLHRGEDLPLYVIDNSGAYMVLGYNAWFDLDTIPFKPYLRPMSSMTKEEKNECNFYCGYKPYYEEEDCGECYLTEYDMPDYIDFLYEHHLDFRGLIEKGLALEAPEDMYKTE